MNIHVDKKTFDQLQSAILLTIKIGSHTYGLNNDNSDTDYLHIIATPKGWANSLVWTHHNLQYKDTENNIDHVFTTLHNFIKNTLTGDSTINYETLYSDEIKKSSLSFLYTMRLDFKSFSLIRAYLGIARRDIKIYTQKNDIKKLSHALRGVWSANQIYIDKYSNDIKLTDIDSYNLMLSLKNGTFNGDKKELIQKINEDTNNLRDLIKTELESKTIHRIMKPESLKIIDDNLKEYCKSSEYLSKVIDDVLIDNIYEILDTDITYDKN